MDNRRLYNYNENYFHNIDSNNKAYWLGFITADGYIMNQNLNKGTKSSAVGLRIRLAESEKPILESFRHDIEGDFPIKTEKNYGKYENQQDLVSIHISSVAIYNDLINLGLSSGNKSCHEKFQDLDTEELTKNFILGLFDGDGWVNRNKLWSSRDQKYRNGYEWGIVSSESMCNDIKKFLEEHIEGIKLNVTKNSKGSDLYRIRSNSKKNIKLLYEYFYLDKCSSSYSQRKYNIFTDIYNEIK